MARLPRVDVGGELYHIINRANARLPIFFKDEDYVLFESILEVAKEKYDMRIIAYCLMPNHFHLILHPRIDGDIQKFMQWVTLTHTQRWHIQNKTVGTGHLYQGRYKSFIIQKDKHLLSVVRYIERNPLRARLVKKAENWAFSSLSKHLHKKSKLLSPWPIEKPDDYLAFVNTSLMEKEECGIQYSINRGKPFGSDDWSNKIIDEYKLMSTTREKGRPKKGT